MEILYDEEHCEFDVLGYYYKNGSEEHYMKAYYGTNVLDPASGFWDFEDYEGNTHSFIEYDETVQEALERFEKKFSSWEIIINRLL